jgi:hypothetical protein
VPVVGCGRSRRSALVIERVDTVAPRSAAWSARE